MDRMTVLYLVASIVLGLAGHSLLKVGAAALGTGGSSMAFMDLVQATLLNPVLMLGLVLYTIGTFAWLLVLSRADLTVAYPYTGLNYVLVLLPSVILLGERVGPIRILGMVLIAFGVYLHSRTVSRSPVAPVSESPALTKVGSP